MTAPILPGVTARCRSCGAALRWVKTTNGKTTPLDAMPVDDGEWQIVRGIAVHVGCTPDLFALDSNRYRVHWSTCPNADEHRRPR